MYYSTTAVFVEHSRIKVYRGYVVNRDDENKLSVA
jgi:hypothetical protein